MTRALRLAARGTFTTQPNPRVGCVLAHGDEIVGGGWHQHVGEPHAEVFALHAAGARARGATAYVTLEPCSHHGRTPPCADALIEAGIARVVMASEDPNPKVSGTGLQRLRDAGIAVATGLMRDAARELNRGFFSRFERGRPWVRVKLAMSLDGRTALANGESKWITGEAARADVQRWRARSSAILTGAGTARADNPRLTVRFDQAHPHPDPPPEGEGSSGYLGERAVAAVSPSQQDDRVFPLPLQGEGRDGDGFVAGASHFQSDFRCEASFKPLRVVLDARLDALQADAHLLDGSAPTLVLHAPGAQPRDERYSRVELAPMELDAAGRLDLEAVLKVLAARGVNELQVEAGPVLCGALLAREWVDELLLYVAPVLLGDAAQPLFALPALAAMTARWRLRNIEQRRLGDDWRILLRPVAANERS